MTMNLVVVIGGYSVNCRYAREYAVVPAGVGRQLEA
jgi:hypothetical protein